LIFIGTKVGVAFHKVSFIFAIHNINIIYALHHSSAAHFFKDYAGAKHNQGRGRTAPDAAGRIDSAKKLPGPV
jgi:hypothetical protein